MVPNSSTLAWKIPWTEEPDRLQSMGSQRVRLDWATSLSLFTFMHWRGKWQPTPAFLPGESQGQGSLMGCRLWGHTSQTRLKQLSSSRTPLSYWTTTSIILEMFFKMIWNISLMFSPATLLSLLICLRANANAQNVLYIFIFKVHLILTS